MVRPPLEVADLIRSAGRSFIERNRSWLNRLHLKVLTAIERCRTSALGGHLDACARCRHRAISFNSCRNRHCPRCQSNERYRWIDARSCELLPTPYVHVVFALPHELAPLALQNKRFVYDLLFRLSAETLLQIARDPKHLGADMASSVCSTVGIRSSNIIHISTASYQPEACHRIARWISSHPKFFLPVDVLADVFRGKFYEALKEAFAQGQLGFHGNLKPLGQPKAFSSLLRQTFRKKWVVYAKRPFGGPSTPYVISVATATA